MEKVKENVKKNKLLTSDTAEELKKNTLCKDCNIKSSRMEISMVFEWKI